MEDSDLQTASPSNSHVTAEAGCDWLPAEPEKPLPSDCCGNGCVPCVMDIYEQEMQLWREECRSGREGKPSAQQEECRSGREGKPSAQKESSDPLTAGPVLSPDKYVTFWLESIQRLTHDTTSDTNVYTFHIPENRQLGLATGQHIILRGSVAGRSVTRQYTPINPPDAKGYFQVLIKVYQTGVMSTYVRSWKVGDRVEWRGPFGTFTYRANQYRHVVMVAAGTGITPMLQVARRVLSNEEDETLEDQQNFHPKYGDEIHHGRLDRAVLSAELPPPGSAVLVLICGTRSFNSDMEESLKALGFPQTDIFRF